MGSLISQIVFALIGLGGIIGLVKLKGLQKIIGGIVLLVSIIASLLIWFG